MPSVPSSTAATAAAIGVSTLLARAISTSTDAVKTPSASWPAIPNFVVQEYARTDESSKWAGFEGVLRRQGGYLLPPEAPGLGLRLVDTSVNEPLGPLGNRPQWDIPLRRDGSVVYAV